MATLAEIEKLKVADLRKELKSKGLSSVGIKSELVERLHLALNSSSADVSDVTEEINEDDVLGDVDDEILAADPKAGNSLLSDDSILSPVHVPVVAPKKTAPAIEKENVTVATLKTTKTVAATKPESKDAKAFCETATSVKVLTPQDRMELRAKRFTGSGTEEMRKLARAERFGIEKNGSTTNGGAVAPNLAKLQQRADRFGSTVSKSLQQLEAKNRLLKRKERFGAIVAPSPGKGVEVNDTNDKKQKRAERFKITL